MKLGFLETKKMTWKRRRPTEELVEDSAKKFFLNKLFSVEVFFVIFLT